MAAEREPFNKDKAYFFLNIMINQIKSKKERFYHLSYESQLKFIVMLMFTDTDGSNNSLAEEFTNSLVEKHGELVFQDLAITLASKKDI